MKNPIHIALVGPECSGKTTLTHQLADHFSSPAVPEMARIYLSEIKRAYQREDVLEIAKLQRKEALAISSRADANFVFHDTEMLTLKIWELEKWGNVSELIKETLDAQKIDLYLLCKPDLPWIDDGIRENPLDRMRLYQIYMDQLNKQLTPFYIVEGFGDIRKERAVELINRWK